MKSILRKHPDSIRFVLLWVLPVVAMMLVVVVPLATGSRTFFQRDVLNTHYGMKWAQAQAMRAGELPMIDLHRAGGQAHLGNPNTVPLYPSNLLFLFGETLWAMNVHFWLHWLLAPLAGYWLGRALRLRRESAWAVGVIYATSGFYLSTLNLYNLVAVVTLAPAFLAAALELSDPARRRRAFVAGAVLWTLMILGGDPVTAAISLLATVGVVAVHHGRRYPWLAAASSIGLGTVLAAPQWVELLRILGFSFRGFWGFGVDLATSGGWRPLDAIEFLIPFPFGQPNLNYWGQHLHAKQVPLFFTLYPGMLVLALLAAARRGADRTFLWAWGLVGTSLFFALGEVNPLVVALSNFPGASLLRIPAKFWSLVTLGFSVLCGLAVGSLFDAAGRRRLARSLAVLALLLLVCWGFMSAFPAAVESRLDQLLPERATEDAAASERLRWAGSCFLGLLLVGLFLLAVRLGRRAPQVAAAAMLALHVATQLLLLRPVLETDERAFYLQRPELLDLLPAGSRVVYAEKSDLFGPTTIPLGTYPGASLLWREREMHRDLYPWSGIRGGLIYELNLSPEGLDSFLTRATAQSLVGFDSDLRRIRVLEATGVNFLLIKRKLDDGALGRVELVTTRPTGGGSLYVYRLPASVNTLEVVGRMRGSANLNEALGQMLHPTFDARRQVVLAGVHEPLSGEPGSARLVARRGDRLEIEVTAPNPAVLVVQRTHLPIYRATIDGEPAGLSAANLHRIGIEVPAGSHRVTLAVDRRPWYASLAAALVAAALLAWIARRGLPRCVVRERPPVAE